MNKKLQQIKEAIEIQKKASDSAYAKWSEEFKILNDLEDSLDEYRLKHGMFYPIEQLKEFADEKEIYQIVLVSKERSGKLKLIELGPADIIEIDKDGKLYVSDYAEGITKWDSKLKRYVQWYCRTESVLPEIVGFYKIEFREESGKYDVAPLDVKTAK